MAGRKPARSCLGSFKTWATNANTPLTEALRKASNDLIETPNHHHEEKCSSAYWSPVRRTRPCLSMFIEAALALKMSVVVSDRGVGEGDAPLDRS